MRNLIRIILVVVLLCVLFINSRPATYHVERSATIGAPAATVYGQISDFHQWAGWSPWEKLDMQMQKTFEGPESGVGASYHWLGNKQVGEGSMKITTAEPASQVGIDLEFIKPFKSSSTATFTLAPDGAGTKVTWAMDGKNNFMSKVMCLFASMDKMVGPDFERGLASLKTIAESAPPAAAASPADAPATAAPKGAAAK